MLKNYLKIAWRNLFRNKIYSVINIAGLSIGLACAMLILLYVKDEVSYDRFHSNGDQIYRVVSQGISDSGVPENKDPNTGYLQGPRFTEAVPEIKAFVRVHGGLIYVKKDAEIATQGILHVEPNFFSMFTFPLLHGNPETCLLQPNSIVLSEDTAIKYFGTADAVGKVLQIKENEEFLPYTVTAVSKNCPQNSSLKFSALLPFEMPIEEAQNSENWFNFFLNTFVQLEPNADVALVDEKIQNVYVNESSEAAKILKEKYGDIGSPVQYFLQPYTDMHLNTELPPQNGLSDASNPTYSYILSGIALFILLIACINFINLTVARSVRRAKEIGIRKVVGGDRKQLIAQFLGESFLLSFMAFAMAILIVQLILPIFNDLANKALSLSYLMDIRLIVGYILLFVITTFLAGFYPALVLSGYDPVQTLYGRFLWSGKGYLQKSLVVLQFTLSSFLIMGTLIIYKQFNYLTNADLGYDYSNTIVLDKDGLKREEVLLFRDKILKNANIVSVTAKNSGVWSTAARVNGEQQISFHIETVDEDYIPQLGIPVVSGRNFSREFPSDSTNSVLVNESFVKEAGWKEPIGKVVDFWYNDNQKYTVVGVVKDYHFLSLNQKIKPQLFTMKKSNWFGTLFVKFKPNTGVESLAQAEKTFRELFPLNPYSYNFMDDNLRRIYESEEKWKQIMLFGAILTIFISCIGLFGLSVLSAEKRTKEIGIRKVLGASVNTVITILSVDFIKLVVISLVVSIPLAWIVSNKWLRNYPYRIEIGWGVFLAAGILVVGIALITVSFQAFKAAISNPVKSLRTE